MNCCLFYKGTHTSLHRHWYKAVKAIDKSQWKRISKRLRCYLSLLLQFPLLFWKVFWSEILDWRIGACQYENVVVFETSFSVRAGKADQYLILKSVIQKTVIGWRNQSSFVLLSTLTNLPNPRITDHRYISKSCSLYVLRTQKKIHRWKSFYLKPILKQAF